MGDISRFSQTHTRKNIRVLITDDHPVFAEGFRKLLDEEEDLECVGIATDGEQAIALTEQLYPDVVVLDIAMPVLDGIKAARIIRKASPDVGILMISNYRNVEYLYECLKIGVNGYLLKNTRLDELFSSIRMVNAGECVFSSQAIKEMGARIRRLQGGIDLELEGIHSRQLEIIQLIARGMSNKEIGAALGISDKTVGSHINSIFRKLGVNTRTEAVFHAINRGWIGKDDILVNTGHDWPSSA